MVAGYKDNACNTETRDMPCGRRAGNKLLNTGHRTLGYSNWKGMYGNY